MEQFEEATLNRGREEGRDDLILKLLENHSPEEVSKDLDIPLDKILEIQGSK